MMQTGILAVTGETQRVAWGGKRNKESQDQCPINVLDGEESDEWGRLKRNGCEFTVIPDEIYSLPVTLKVDLS